MPKGRRRCVKQLESQPSWLLWWWVMVIHQHARFYGHIDINLEHFHHAADSITTKDPQHVVLQTQKESGASRISLPTESKTSECTSQARVLQYNHGAHICNINLPHDMKRRLLWSLLFDSLGAEKRFTALLQVCHYLMETLFFYKQNSSAVSQTVHTVWIGRAFYEGALSWGFDGHWARPVECWRAEATK